MAREKGDFISSSHRSPPADEFYASESPRNNQYRDDKDVFGNEKHHGIHYRTLSWPLVAFLMITEIVTYGTLSLPSSLAVVGIVPGVILIIFLGVFALYTALVLVQFKLNHPEGISLQFHA